MSTPKPESKGLDGILEFMELVGNLKVRELGESAPLIHDTEFFLLFCSSIWSGPGGSSAMWIIVKPSPGTCTGWLCWHSSWMTTPNWIALNAWNWVNAIEINRSDRTDNEFRLSFLQHLFTIWLRALSGTSLRTAACPERRSSGGKWRQCMRSSARWLRWVSALWNYLKWVETQGIAMQGDRVSSAY